MSIFKEESGKWSSKRIAGLASFATCIGSFLFVTIKTGTVDFTMWAALLGVATAVLGITAFKKPQSQATVDGTKDGGPKT